MLKAKCLAQGSKGNSWILTYNDDMLVLDAGIKSMLIKRGIDYNIVGVKGVFISHKHKDHSMAVDDLKNMGLKVYTPYLDGENPKKTVAEPFTVQYFSLPHDDCTNYGFFIKVADRRIIYATDFEYIPQSFKNVRLTDMIIECNYQTEYLPMLSEHLSHKVIGHAELQTVKKFVEHNVTDDLQNVIITHLGIDTCNGNECVKEIKKIVPENVNVDYARANETYILKGGM